MRHYSEPRFSHDDDGKRYVVRDVLKSPVRVGYYEFAGWCQYARRRDDGCVVWRPCPEGVKWAEIEAFDG